MDDVFLQTFPRDELEALAMLYVQRQDLSDVSPRDLLDMYEDAYNQIAGYAKEKADSKVEWF